MNVIRELNSKAPVLTLRRVIPFPSRRDKKEIMAKSKLRTNLRPSPGGAHVMSVWGDRKESHPATL